MAEERITLLTAREAAQYLRVSLYTLNKIEKDGRLIPFRTPGGHRRYSLEMLNEYLESSRFLYGPASHQEVSVSAAKAAESVGAVKRQEARVEEEEQEPELAQPEIP